MSGARLGKAIAHIVAETMTAHKQATLPGETAYKQKADTAKYEGWEQEVLPFAQKLMKHVSDTGAADGPLKVIMDTVNGPTHQVELAILIPLLLGAGFKIAGEVTMPFIQAVMNKIWAQFPNNPLSAQEMAVAVTKGTMDFNDARAEAEHSGYSKDRLQWLVDITGDAPGPMELLAAYRRGIIDDARLEHGIRGGMLKNEWTDVIKQLRFVPPSSAEAIAALVQGHVDQATAQKWSAESGMLPEAFQALYETAGMPISPGEALDLMRRGEMSQSEVEQSIRESHVKNKYIPAIINLARKLIPPRSVGTMVAHGSLSQATGIQYLQMYGYTASDATAVVHNAMAQKHAATKELAKGEVFSLYEQQLIDEATAKSDLKKLGYDDAEITLLIGLADHKRETQIKSSAVKLTGSRYVARHITKDQASSNLGALGIPDAARQTIMKLWDLELAATPKMLTEAQVGALAKKGIIDLAEFTSRLQAMGMNDVDINLLAQYYGVK